MRGRDLEGADRFGYARLGGCELGEQDATAEAPGWSVGTEVTQYRMPIITNLYNVHTEGRAGRQGWRDGGFGAMGTVVGFRSTAYLAVMYRKSMSIALAGRRRRVSLGARSIELEGSSNHNWSPSEQSIRVSLHERVPGWKGTYISEWRQSHEHDENRSRGTTRSGTVVANNDTELGPSGCKRTAQGLGPQAVDRRAVLLRGGSGVTRQPANQTQSRTPPTALPCAHRRRNSRVSGRTAGFTPSIAGLGSDLVFREPLELRWRPAMEKSHAG